MLLELERSRRMTAEAQIATILEMNQVADEHSIGAEDGGILGLHRQLLSLKLKVHTLPLIHLFGINLCRCSLNHKNLSRHVRISSHLPLS